MALPERARSRETERRRHPELRQYSRTLSDAILQGEKEIPDRVLESFHERSLEDRDKYWQKEKGPENFGTQMMTWLGREGKPGIAQWVAKQTDGDVTSILQEVGLKSTPEQTKKDLQGEGVAKLVSVINADLEKAGKPTLDVESLSEEEARSLIFYTHYLTGEKGTEDVKSFINTVVGVAQEQSNNNLDETIVKLQKITPLLNVAGEEGKYALGALLVAKAHANTPQTAPAEEKALNEHEARVVTFFNRRMGPEALELGEAHAVVQVFEGLTPKAKPEENPYWIAGEVPADFAEKLTDEQVNELAFNPQKPLFLNVKYENTPQGKMLHRQLNREVFDPAYSLKENRRFTNAELLTENDSGLFALAAASAETPEKQAVLYRQLGETVLRAHSLNPKLLESFLKAQTEGSLEALLNDEAKLFIPQEFGEATRLDQNIAMQIHQKYPKVTTIQPGTPEAAYRDQLIAQGTAQLAEFRKQLLEDISQDPERLYVIAHKEVSLGAVEELPYQIDIAKTVEAWPERVKSLQEALHKTPLELTVEQIRQIEFLSHSVNTMRVMELLKGSAIVVSQTTEVPTPEMPVEAPAQAAVESVEEEPAMTLQEFFADIATYESTIPETIKPRREEAKIADSTHLAQFATLGEDPSRFEIADHGELALFTPQGESETLNYNTRNPFLGLLMEPNTISEQTYKNFLKQGMGPHTLLSYVLEASSGVNQQEALYKNLFLQVADIYKEHPDVGEKIKTYFANIPLQQYFVDSELEGNNIDRLFASPEQTQERLTQLTEALRNNSMLSRQDIIDMGVLALPFNLQYIAQRMVDAYRIRSATDELHEQGEVESPQQ